MRLEFGGSKFIPSQVCKGLWSSALGKGRDKQSSTKTAPDKFTPEEIGISSRGSQDTR